MPVSFSGLSHSDFIFVQTFLIFPCLSLLELNACAGTMSIPELFTPVSRNLLHNLALLISNFLPPSHLELLQGKGCVSFSFMSRSCLAQSRYSTYAWWMTGWIIRWVDWWISDEWMDWWMNGWMMERWWKMMDRWIDGWVDGWVDRWMKDDGWMDDRMDGWWIDAQVDRWMKDGEWMDRRLMDDELMDG